MPRHTYITPEMNTAIDAIGRLGANPTHNDLAAALAGVPRAQWHLVIKQAARAHMLDWDTLAPNFKAGGMTAKGVEGYIPSIGGAAPVSQPIDQCPVVILRNASCTIRWRPTFDGRKVSKFLASSYGPVDAKKKSEKKYRELFEKIYSHTSCDTGLPLNQIAGLFMPDDERKQNPFVVGLDITFQKYRLWWNVRADADAGSQAMQKILAAKAFKKRQRKLYARIVRNAKRVGPLASRFMSDQLNLINDGNKLASREAARKDRRKKRKPLRARV